MHDLKAVESSWKDGIRCNFISIMVTACIAIKCGSVVVSAAIFFAAAMISTLCRTWQLQRTTMWHPDSWDGFEKFESRSAFSAIHPVMTDVGVARVHHDEVAQLLKGLPCWSGGGELQVTSCNETEWHQIFIVRNGKSKVVASIPSWRGLDLESKILASEALGAVDQLGPKHVATHRSGEMIVLVDEFLEGGTLSIDDLTPTTLQDVGRLYARLHRSDVAWFEPIRQRLMESQLLTAAECDWAGCLWLLPRLQSLVPEKNAEQLAAEGIDWDFVSKEIRALPFNDALPRNGVTTSTVCVHGDAHLGNIMWHRGQLRLIDFDMTAVGPAGADLAYLVLMLFRCGFSPDAVAKVEAQRCFAEGYLLGMGLDASEQALEDFLFDMHRWAYVGLLQMGLLCAVLMNNEGDPRKRQLMHERGPVLLHPKFLSKAKEVLRQAMTEKMVRERLIKAVNLKGPPPPEVLRCLAPPSEDDVSQEEDGKTASSERQKEVISPVSPKVVEELASLRWELQERQRTVSSLEELVDLLQTRCRELEDESRELVNLAASKHEQEQLEAGVPHERRDEDDYIATIKERQLSREPIPPLGVSHRKANISVSASGAVGPSSKTRTMAELQAKLVQNDALGKVGGERDGLTSAEAKKRMEEYGPNEIPVIETPIWKMILSQFVGTMPVMLEVSCIISAAAGDWPDFFVILAMVLVNAALGFREEMKAKNALAELTNQMESSIPCLRDGKTESLPVSKLVPGDVIHLRGGALTPADVEWLEGDILSIDTAALTGEPLPRKYPSEEYGKLILSGTTVKSGEAYCVVRLTGTNTEIGQGQADIMADRASASVSVFEQKVMVVVNIIISIAVLDAICIVLVQGLVRNGFDVDFKGTLLTALSILIAAVPIALPLVLQVTMAIGAYRMATETWTLQKPDFEDHHAIVTRMSALQDIASMDVLCSDKTGTLTTAKMSINLEKIWTAKKDGTLRKVRGGRFTGGASRPSRGFSILDPYYYRSPNQDLAAQQMLLVMGIMCSNPDKKDDAIDGALLRAWDKMKQEQGDAPAKMKEGYQQLDLTGFNPEVKRTVATVKRLYDDRKLIVAKGLASKILDTSSGGQDSGKLQWTCEECKEEGFLEMVQKTDQELSSKGYKTIAVAAGIEGEGMHFLGLLPMIDPPRYDTAITVQRLMNSGVEVKMITGDHLNIAIETARMVGMATNILPGEATREGGHTGDETIREAGGFAQVLPRDKRECVLALQRSYELVVGMTGDGVNDAPALSAAQCGIADATDAAKNAAAMILTTEGLSAVFGAVVESRKIFARLFSYVSYRLAATIQILLYLSILVYVFDCTLDPLYVILLALFNDVTMIPVAEDTGGIPGDNQTAAAEPQHAVVGHLIGFSMTLGIFQSVASIIFYLCMDMGLIHGIESHRVTGHYPTSVHAQNAIWLQVSIAAEFLIFSARSPGLFFFSRPSTELLFSTMAGNVVSTLLAVYAFPEPLSLGECVTVWVYDIAALLAVDLAKMVYKFIHEADAAGVIDESLGNDVSGWYQMAMEDAQLKHGDETKPIENPEAHLKAYRESVKIMKQNSVRLSQKQRTSMKFLSTGQQRASRVISQSSNMSGKGHTQMRSSVKMGDDLRKRTPATSVELAQFCPDRTEVCRTSMRSNLSTERDLEMERLKLRCEELEEERMRLEMQLEESKAQGSSLAATLKQSGINVAGDRNDSESEDAEEKEEREDLEARCLRLEAEKEKLQKHVERLWQMCEALDASAKPEQQQLQGRQGSLEELNFEAVVERAVSMKATERQQLVRAEAEKAELQELTEALTAQVQALQERLRSEDQEVTIGAVARCEDLTRQKAEVEKELGELATAYAELQGNLNAQKRLRLEAEEALQSERKALEEAQRALEDRGVQSEPKEAAEREAEPESNLEALRQGWRIAGSFVVQTAIPSGSDAQPVVFCTPLAPWTPSKTGDHPLPEIPWENLPLEMILIPGIAAVLVLWLWCRWHVRGLSPRRQRYLLEAAAQVATARRLRILGCCAAGKSQLRGSLGKVLQLPLVEDTLGILAESLGDSWILDGNFMSKPRDLEGLNRQIWENTQIGTGEPCCNGNRETWSLLLCDFRNSIPYFVWTGHGKFPERLKELERIFEAELGERGSQEACSLDQQLLSIEVYELATLAAERDQLKAMETQLQHAEVAVEEQMQLVSQAEAVAEEQKQLRFQVEAQLEEQALLNRRLEASLEEETQMRSKAEAQAAEQMQLRSQVEASLDAERLAREEVLRRSMETSRTSTTTQEVPEGNQLDRPQHMILQRFGGQRNTFFDIPEDDADLPEGPATCPPASDGWWPSSSSRPSSDGPSWPSSPAFFDLPTLNETDSTVLTSPAVPNTPDQWMDSFVHRPGPCGAELRATLAVPVATPVATPSPVLQTPDWFERVSPMKPQQARHFDLMVGKATTASTPSDARSSSAKSPGESSSIAQRTPDPFEDTPSPYGRSPTSRFNQLLAAEVAGKDASERSPVQASEVSGDSFGLQSSWARPLMKPPVLLATAPGAAAVNAGAPPGAPGAPGAPGVPGVPGVPGAPAPTAMPPMAPPGSLLPMAPLGLPMVPPMGLVPPYPLVPDGGFGLWPHGQSYMDVMHQKEPQMPRKKGGGAASGAGSTTPSRPSNQKAPLPAGLLLPGEVSKPPGVDGEDSPCKARRKRGGRESKDPDISGDDPYGLLPSGAFIDLGLLERRKKP
eukprot:s391_g17.t2